MTINGNGGDDYVNRLLSYFKQKFVEKIKEVSQVRENVFIVKTIKNMYMLKGYSSNHKLKLQEVFTATLRNEGFNHSYIFLQEPIKEPLIFEGTYFGCMEYIEPGKRPFTFQSYKSRMEGLELLEEFHQTTALIAPRYRTLIPIGDIQEKWKERIHTFSKNTYYLRYFLKEHFIYEILDWGNWSLSGLNEKSAFFSQEPDVILHGDVAHHNFLREKSGDLKLIDFDLISIGPEYLDILQYANRILPSIDWSFDFLVKHKQINKYLNEKPFLYALAYPTDIYREWNRLIREKNLTDTYKCKQVMELMLEQFYLRRKFVLKLQELVK
ncbi:MAG: aminoglycoside phosphotransferase [Bacillota bacterium]|nr:aminoglycoside phosphotransferase [Bacillota bacterium]